MARTSCRKYRNDCCSVKLGTSFPLTIFMMAPLSHKSNTSTQKKKKKGDEY